MFSPVFHIIVLLLGVLWSFNACATVVDLKINDSDGPLQVADGTPLVPNLRIEPDGSLRAAPSDWWLAVQGADTWAFWVYPNGWQTGLAPAERDCRSFQPGGKTSTLRPGITTATASQLAFGATVRTANTPTVTKTSRTVAPSVGVMLSGQDSGGAGYLGRVTAVSDTGTDLSF